MRYIFFLALELIYLLNLLMGNLGIVLEMSLLVFVLYYIRKIETRAMGDSELTGREKKVVLMTEFLAPVVAGAFYYYCWKGKLPTKAKWANRSSWIIFGLQLITGLVLYKLGLIS